MTKTEKVLGLGVLIAIVLAVGALFVGHAQAPVGAVAPTDISATNLTEGTFRDGLAVGSLSQFQVGSTGALTQGGGVSATTTNGSTLLTDSLWDTENVVSITQNVGASMTATLPSGSAITRIRNAGDSFTVVLVNGTTTAGEPITFARGANMQLFSASSTANKLVLNAGEVGTLQIMAPTSTASVIAIFTPVK